MSDGAAAAPPPPLPAEVLRRFGELWERVTSSDDLREPTSVVLATADARARPSARTVLLKSWGADGFVLYTNLRSRKAEQIGENPCGALSFFWPGLMEQVQIEGAIEMVSDEEADAHWVTRSLESRVGAWASRQSATLSARGDLERRIEEVSQRFEGDDVPRPPFWSGFRLVPDRVEFWVSRPHRLHDREVWELENGRWAVRRLYP